MDPENWSQLEVILGTQLLADVCGPFDDDNVDRRLRFLTELVTSLRRRYDNAGIREWFLHAQVAERTPAEVLAGSWLPEDESVHRLRTAAPALR